MRGVMNLGNLLAQTAARFPERPGFVQDNETHSWRALDREANAMTAALADLGICKGDRILVVSRNNRQMFLSMWVAFRLGAVWVPTNFRLAPPEIAQIARTSGAVAMIYDEGFKEHVDAARAATPTLRRVISIVSPRAGEQAWQGLRDVHDGARPGTAAVDYNDPLWFFFTSGTTGSPKAAELTHGQMAFVVTNHLADLMPGLGPDDASLVVAPLSHGAGIHAMAQVTRGAVSVLLPGGFDGEAVWRLVERNRITNMFTVPSILKMMVEHPAVDRHDHGTLKHVIYAGAPMYVEDQKRALAKLGRVLVQYYGLGEVTGNITVLPAHLHPLDDDEAPARVGTCGYARTGMEVSVQNDAGRPLPPGEIGEICVRGPAVFKGYFNNPEANAVAFRDGWFRTGDLGWLDEAGFLYITGRASDMYISGGVNVYPREIEEAMLTHPAVAEVAVVGIADPRWGETGVAAVVLRPDAEVAAEALLGWLDGRIARFKRPSRIVFWDALPKSGYGKISKHLVREQLAERGELSPSD